MNISQQRKLQYVLWAGFALTFARVPEITSDDGDPPEEDLVFVTEDVAFIEPGCDAVSVFRVPSGDSEFRGDTHVSPGRLSANPALTLVLATSNNTRRFVYTLARSDDSSRDWESSVMIGASFSTFGGIAVLRDESQFLVATSGTRLLNANGPNLPPHAVQKFDVPTLLRGEQRVGPSRGSFSVGGVAVEILLDPYEPIAHILTDESMIYSIDIETMSEVADPIDVPELIAPRNPNHLKPIDYYHASIDSTGRYIVTNGGSGRHIGVVDLKSRTSWPLAVPSDIDFVGGLALNWASTNSGLLAIHGVNAIAVFAVAEDMHSMSERSQAPIRPPRISASFYNLGPKLSIAWSESGENIIAATDEGASEFAILAHSAEGTTVVGRIAACTKDSNFPNDVLTSNGLIPVATPTLTPTSTPVLTLTPTATTPPPHRGFDRYTLTLRHDGANLDTNAPS